MAGSIEKRAKNSYRLVCLAGYDLQGKTIKKTKTIHGTKKEAEIELAKFVADVQNGMFVEGKSLKFSEFTEIWKRDYASKELAPSTYKRYCRILETRLLPYFGHFYINKIKPTDIMHFYDLLSRDTQLVRKRGNNGKKTLKPLSGKTILEHHRLLRAMLHKAVYWQLIISNPAERVQPPKARKPKRRYYDDEQCKILLQNGISIATLINKSSDNLNVCFTVKSSQVAKTEDILQNKLKGISYFINNISRVSIVGYGIANDLKVITKLFDILKKEQIEILSIQIDECKISVMANKKIECGILEKLHSELIA